MIAMLIDDPLTPLGMLIWFGDEGQGHGRRASAANAGLPPAGSERH
ncbi:MAG TPA: hypothetical protein VGS10_14865 [Terracidiphilus sp.]|nr:hypothetical protein [Terracidiphilus sp.]